ncbi:sensor histidine kinase [Anaeromyxobacter paludicola]|uniref:sensor histidine kinase n=1 Tax=Anaeromyxobacter paludicola TaxID=2918171 RepID=UPI0020BFE091|nr:HAMP domain-containing sensor histidine kinase [Anaeromyxobacter paludicola]
MSAATRELRRAAGALERRSAERATALELELRRRDEFLAVASHELRTPLSALGLSLETLLQAGERLAPAELTRRLERAIRQCQRLQRTVEELLGHPGQPEEAGLQPCDLCELAREAVEQCAALLERAGCAVEVRAARPVVATLDPWRIGRALTNLLVNAARHAPGAPVEVAVDRRGSRAVVAVSDRGPGVPAGERERIFERFVQLSPERGGFGLGLWIVRQIADLHRGRVVVEPRPGGGARFVLALPAAVP